MPSGVGDRKHGFGRRRVVDLKQVSSDGKTTISAACTGFARVVVCIISAGKSRRASIDQSVAGRFASFTHYGQMPSGVGHGKHGFGRRGVVDLEQVSCTSRLMVGEQIALVAPFGAVSVREPLVASEGKPVTPFEA
jgi:hypothetical protein